MKSVYQLLETTDKQEIIKEYDKYCPFRVGELTTKWIDRLKSLLALPGGEKGEEKKEGEKNEEEKTKEEKWKLCSERLEIYVACEELLEDTKSPRRWLRINGRDENCDYWAISYTSWARVLGYPVCAADVERYGAPLMLAAIIDDITFHGWEEEQTRMVFGGITDRRTRTKGDD